VLGGRVLPPLLEVVVAGGPLPPTAPGKRRAHAPPGERHTTALPSLARRRPSGRRRRPRRPRRHPSHSDRVVGHEPAAARDVVGLELEQVHADAFQRQPDRDQGHHRIPRCLITTARGSVKNSRE